jgi:16S rRNA (guanine527-N7)-methyltransferase
MHNLFYELARPDDSVIEKLENFYTAHVNARINITAIKSREDFYIKHYLDSIYIFQKHVFNFKTLIDVGSGGGFPGVVIAIFYPQSHIYLIESIRKKCLFLTDAIKKSKIENITIINDRVENINNIKGDVITARAVGPIKNIIKYTLQLSHDNTKWIIYKGMNIDSEIANSQKLLTKYELKLNIERIDEPFKRTYTVISY